MRFDLPRLEAAAPAAGAGRPRSSAFPASTATMAPSTAATSGAATTAAATTAAATGAEAIRDAKMQDAAHAFEASLMQELFKPLTDDSLGIQEGSDQENSSNPLGAFATEAMARAVADRGGFGIARQLIEHFRKTEAKPAAFASFRSSSPPARR